MWVTWSGPKDRKDSGFPVTGEQEVWRVGCLSAMPFHFYKVKCSGGGLHSSVSVEVCAADMHTHRVMVKMINFTVPIFYHNWDNHKFPIYYLQFWLLPPVSRAIPCTHAYGCIAPLQIIILSTCFTMDSSTYTQWKQISLVILNHRHKWMQESQRVIANS